MMVNRGIRLGVLIDAENTSDKIAAGLFREIAKIGDACVRRIYGDFSGPQLRGWVDTLHQYGLVPHQQFAQATGKNAADIALVIDAMDLLHGGRLDGFCLVSSDSDFTRLAMRIREQGMAVFGFGKSNTPECFRQVCHRFVCVEDLLVPLPTPSPTVPISIAEKAPIVAVAKTPPTKAQAPKTVAKTVVAAPSPLPKKPVAPKAVPAKAPKAAAAKTPPPKKETKPGLALPLMTKAFGQLDGKEGWVDMGALGNELSRLAPGFDPRNFGFKKLSDLARGTNRFEVAKANGVLRIRSL